MYFDTPRRWKAALSAAARQTLPARWLSVTRALRAAEFEYRALYAADDIDILALRKAARRVDELTYLRAALAGALRDERA
jgi:lysyl-tRNA synthetase class I